MSLCGGFTLTNELLLYCNSKSTVLCLIINTIQKQSSTDRQSIGIHYGGRDVARVASQVAFFHNS